jgi:hypothetical protein
VSAGPFSQFVIGVPGGNTIAVGNPFLFTVQAADSFGNLVTSYSGPTSVAATLSPPDPQGNLPITGTLNSSGFGFFLANLKTPGSYTLTATAGALSGTSASLTVTPSAPSYFTVTTPAAAITGTPINVTVTAYDYFGNIATGYTGTVKLTSSEPAAATVAGSYTFTTGAGKDNGVHTFSVTLLTAGNQQLHHDPRLGGHGPDADGDRLHGHLQRAVYRGRCQPLRRLPGQPAPGCHLGRQGEWPGQWLLRRRPVGDKRYLQGVVNLPVYLLPVLRAACRYLDSHPR